MQEPGVDEGREGERKSGGAGTVTEVTLLHEPKDGSGEGDAEGLVPPAAPKARETAVEDLCDGAEDGAVAPGLAADGEEVAADEELDEVDVGDDEEYEGVDSKEDQETAAGMEEGRGNVSEVRG